MTDIEDLNDIYDDDAHHVNLDELFKNKKVNKNTDENINENINENMKTSEIISASRRTDIPAFYINDIIQHMRNEHIEVPNPRSNKVSILSLDSKNVKCFVWWSKDYHNWIEAYKNNKELFDKYKHVFNFTINGYDALENGITHSLDERLDDLKYLALTFGANTIKYRFDPIVYYKNKGDDTELNNLINFEKIIKFVSECGVFNCQFAFCLAYPNVERRMKFRNKQIVYLSLDRQKQVLDDLINVCDQYNVILYACCNSDLLGYKDKIKRSACIDRAQIENILGKNLKKHNKDGGQRKECGCVQSRDIGNYKMKCDHNCDYCYAAK